MSPSGRFFCLLWPLCIKSFPVMSGGLWLSVHSWVQSTKKQMRNPVWTGSLEAWAPAVRRQGPEPFSVVWSVPVSCTWEWWSGKRPGSGSPCVPSFCPHVLAIPAFESAMADLGGVGLYTMSPAWYQYQCKVPWGQAPGGLVPGRVSCPHPASRRQLWVQARMGVIPAGNDGDCPCRQDCAVV